MYRTFLSYNISKPKYPEEKCYSHQFVNAGTIGMPSRLIPVMGLV